MNAHPDKLIFKTFVATAFFLSFLLMPASSSAMGQSSPYIYGASNPTTGSGSNLSSMFEEIQSTDEAKNFSTLGIQLYYAKSPVDYDLNDSLKTHIHSDAVDLTLAGQVASFVYNEIKNYPQSCLQKTGFNKVLITSGLIRSYASQTGAVKIVVGAAPIFGQGSMAYDASLIQKGTLDIFAVTVVNHEYLHYIDYEDGHLDTDNAWMQLNTSCSPYGAGGDFDRTTGYGDWDSSLKCYLDLYSEAAMKEDKAEIFGGLAARPDQLAQRAGADAVLAQKVALLKSELQNYCSDMSSFWATEESTQASRLAFVDKLIPATLSSDGQWVLNPTTHQWMLSNPDPSAHNGYLWDSNSGTWVKAPAQKK